MTDIIAVVNQKGGVAKTTTTIHIGVALAQLGKNVLLVDLDSQGHLAEGFGIVADRIEQEMSDVFEGSKSIKDIIMPNLRPHLDLAPINVRLADMELTLVNMRFRESKLKRALEPVTSYYDYVFFIRTDLTIYPYKSRCYRLIKICGFLYSCLCTVHVMSKRKYVC